MLKFLLFDCLYFLVSVFLKFFYFFVLFTKGQLDGGYINLSIV